MSNKVAEVLQKALELIQKNGNNDITNALQAMHDFSLTNDASGYSDKFDKELENDPLLLEAIKTIERIYNKDKQ